MSKLSKRSNTEEWEEENIDYGDSYPDSTSSQYDSDDEYDTDLDIPEEVQCSSEFPKS